MQLFYLINGWAGRSDWLDGALRFFYIGAVPLLWTALAALLIFAPRSREENSLASPRRIAGASLLSLALCALVVWLVHLVQTQLLNGAPISPRPFMTRWVNALVVEPNDNTFPCFEVMLAGAAATLLWAARPGAGVLGWLAVLLLGFARIFCGANYPGDSLAGAFLGGAIGLVSLAAWRVPLQLPVVKSGARRLKWRVSHQAIFGAVSLVGFTLFCGYSLTTTSPYASRFKPFWNPTSAAAAQSHLGSNASAKLVTATLSGIHEGEGGAPSNDDSAPMSEPGKLLLSSRAARLDGHLPTAETTLLRALSTPDLGHRIIGVNVAQVRAGNSAYRCAAIRFEVTKTGADERRRVAQTAAGCVKRAFHADGQLQHVDVLGIDLRPGDAAPRASGEYSQGESGSHAHRAEVAPRHGVRVVFTASIERDDLIVKNKPAWVNWSGLDGGAWLRARSALYIDDEILPAAPPSPKPAPAVAPLQPIEKTPAKPAAPVKPPQKIIPKSVVPKTIAPKPAPQKQVAPQQKRAVTRSGSTPRRKRYRRKKRRGVRRSR